MSHIKSKKLIPVFFILAFTAFLSIPNNIMYFGIYTPEYIICIVFYYVFLRPKYIPTPTIIFVGVMYDIIMKYPIGIHIFLFLILSKLIEINRKFLIHKNFNTIWLFFCVNIISITLLKTIILNAIYHLPYDSMFASSFLRVYLTFLAYPLIHFCLDKFSIISGLYEKN